MAITEQENAALQEMMRCLSHRHQIVMTETTRVDNGERVLLLSFYYEQQGRVNMFPFAEFIMGNIEPYNPPAELERTRGPVAPLVATEEDPTGGLPPIQ